MGTLLPHEDRSWWTVGVDPPSTGTSIEVVDPEEVLGIGVGRDILVVDDDPANLTAYEAALAPLGRRLVLARSGTEALAKLLEQDFALVLLDVAMPELTGLETARLARERPRNHGLPIVFITGASSSGETIAQAYELGGFDFVVKPIAPTLLRAKVNVYLQLQERTQALLRNVRRLAQTQQRLSESEVEVLEGRRAAANALRLDRLRILTAALWRATTPRDVAAVIVRNGVEAVGASAAAIWLVERADRMELIASHGVPDEYLDVWRNVSRHAALPVTRVLDGGEPLWAEDAADFVRLAPEIVPRAAPAGRMWAFAALPIRSNEEVHGVLCFTFEGEHHFTEDERRFLTVLAQTCEQALDRARLYAVESRARQEAESSNSRKDQYLAMLGHELRNPLAAMSSALELVRVRDGQLRPELTILERQLKHLAHLVDDLVDASRLTHGQITLRREAVDTSEAIADAIELVRPLLLQHAPALRVDAPPGVLVDADRSRFVQVLANLLSNAARFVGDGGWIEVSTRQDNDRVEICVRDNGAGIPAELLPRVFDAFVQGEQPLHRPYGGLGIGLTLVRILIDLHGGEVTAESEGVGRGATFRIVWPSASSQLVASADVAAKPVKLRALVVDDNEDAALLFASLLEELGHQATFAHDARTALAIAGTFSPDVAFLALPTSAGCELGERIRELPTCAKTALVALTIHGDLEHAERAERAGFDHQFVKPMDLRTLTQLLASIKRADRET